MSRATVLAVSPNCRPAELLELSNAFGWAPSIWDRLLRHHGHMDGWLRSAGPLQTLWESIGDLPAWQQVPLVLTFDTGVIPGEHAVWAADRLAEFEAHLPSSEHYVNHVPAVERLLRGQPEAPFIGVWGTSVTDNPFDPWNEDGPGEGIPLSAMHVLQKR